MRYTEIAPAQPFEGAPRINLASVYGASPDRPILMKIPVTGQRPLTYGAEGLPEGLTLENGIVRVPNGIFGVAPGQSAVMYSPDGTILCGGVIEDR